MDFSELLHGFGFAEIEKWISVGGYMDLSKLLRGLVNVVLCISCSLSNKTKLKFDQYFKLMHLL